MAMKLVTAAQMREIDRHAIEDLNIPGMVLMENAGRGVARCAERVLRALGGTRVHVVAGRGNNGGDSFVAARHLHNAGYDVAVTLLAAASDLRGDAAANHRICAAMGATIDEMPELPSPTSLREHLVGADVVIDGILGTGITGEVHGAARAAIDAFRDIARQRVVAIDIPSGIDSDTGQVLGAAVTAGHTVTFGLPKIGLYQHPGAARAGEVLVQEIGLPPAELTSDRLPIHLTTPADVARWLPARRPDAHKGDCGRIFIVAGSVGMTGAAAMAGMSALRTGAGLVTVGVPVARRARMAPRVGTFPGSFVSESVARWRSVRASTISTRAASSLGSNGLLMQSSAPARIMATRWSRSAVAVTMTMGTWAVNGLLRRSLMTSIPFFSGIM